MPNLLDNSTETNLLIGGLALLVVAIVVIVLFWRMSRRARTTAPPPTQSSTRAVPLEPASATTPPPPQPVEITLEFISDTGQPVIFKLDKPVLTVGRGSDNDIVIPAAVPNVITVSQCHARLSRDQDEYVVRDLGSKNGLTVNGRQTLENLLQDGDQIGFGTATAIFHQPLAIGAAAYRSGPKPGGAA